MKRFLTISVLLRAVTGLMTLALVAVFAGYALRALESQEQARRVPLIVDISNDLFAAIQNIRVERSAIHDSLVTPEVIDIDMQKEIGDTRARSAKALDSALAKMDAIALTKIGPAIGEIRESRNALTLLRGRIDPALHQPLDRRPANLATDWVEGNGKFVSAIEHLASQLESELTLGDPFIADMIKIKQITWAVRSDTGDDRLHIREAMLRDVEEVFDVKLSIAGLGGVSEDPRMASHVAPAPRPKAARIRSGMDGPNRWVGRLGFLLGIAIKIDSLVP
jgi:hypothetical protein